ncbi:MAG: hypothetical protein JXA96_06555 [Sedimentisphaerales bacterium]|nr:hypothetical protein [Sedimentisphaerales bacterium]
MSSTENNDSEYVHHTENAFRKLFECAKSKNEVQFALALAPEFRGEQGPGWCTWEETNRAFKEYLDFINQKFNSIIKIRVSLAFYCHLSEASGFYEMPKNMMRIAGGEDYRMWPFLELNRTHGETGKKIAPNSNKIFRDLIGHAESLDLKELVEVFSDAFDPEIRNAYAHADYIIWKDGFRMPNQGCGHPKIIRWNEFNLKISRALNFYQIIRKLAEEYIMSYKTPKEVIASMGGGQPEFKWKIETDENGGIMISSNGF